MPYRDFFSTIEGVLKSKQKEFTDALKSHVIDNIIQSVRERYSCNVNRDNIEKHPKYNVLSTTINMAMKYWTDSNKEALEFNSLSNKSEALYEQTEQSKEYKKTQNMLLQKYNLLASLETNMNNVLQEVKLTQEEIANSLDQKISNQSDSL